MKRIAAILSLILVSPAMATTWYVSTTGNDSHDGSEGSPFATIQHAIIASSNGDVIAIAAGTYNEHSLNTGGKAITIGSASGNLDVTIDAQQGGRVFNMWSGEGDGTVIKDLVITGGYGSSGGGIHCSHTNPTISNCTIEGNWATSYGGGIYCYDSNPTITGCTISGNTADYEGGGIYCYSNSNPTISGCTIEGNTGNYFGGGIYCEEYSNPTISGCTISGNTAYYGGGISCYDSNPTITGCTIEGNTVDYEGGGIYCDSSNPTISDSQICGNDPDQIDGPWTDAGGNTVADECPDGACCVGSSCLVVTETNCIAAGGTYQGDNSDCNGDPCWQDSDGDGVHDADDAFPNDPNEWADSDGDSVGDNADNYFENYAHGACCVSSGCDPLTEDACAGMGGTWLGEDASCDECSTPCPADLNGDNIVDGVDLSLLLGAWSICP